jgi:tetratricopeptide (TPR) repeat protein
VTTFRTEHVGVSTGAANERLGSYRLLHEIGRGGQAVVWLAEDTRLGRRVALKILPALGPGSEAVLRRFQREAEVTSKLEHPAICPIYEADIAGGVPFLAMRFVDGETLARRVARCSGGPVLGDWNATATFFARAARALHAAHEAGVLHRDIKPANVMVTPAGDPVLLDFGLARSDGEDVGSLSRSGDNSGTPTYMSPEQMSGRAPLDRRSDVYSLGCTLFECLTGRAPFTAPTLAGLLQAVLHEDIKDVRSLRADVPDDLAVIVATATAKDRDRRYRSALELALDLERFVQIEPIAARPESRLQRARRWVRRNPALAGSLAAVLVLLLTAMTLLSYGLGAAGRAELEARLRQQADRELARAEAERAIQRQATADRELATRADDLSMRLGTLSFGVAGGAEGIAALAPEFEAVLRDAGILVAWDADVEPAIAALRAVQQRDSDAGRALLAAVRNLALLSGESPERRRLLQQVSAAFHDAALRSFAAARDRWQQQRVDEFGPLLDNAALAALGPEQCAEAASMMMRVDGREAVVLALLDRAIQLRPDSFALHYQRAGLALGRAGAVAGSPPALSHVQSAVEHLRAAVALRPQSGLARAVLAGALAFRAHLGGDDAGFAAAWAMMATATEVEPRSSLVWLLRADFLRRMPDQLDDARAACERALQLEPGLVPAQQLLRQLPGK